MKTYSQTAITGDEWRTIEEVMEFCEITPKEEIRVRQLLEIRARDTSLPFRAYHAAHVACAQVVRERTSKPQEGAK
ncbi:hypothetical protein [Achromobacter sp. AGC39]